MKAASRSSDRLFVPREEFIVEYEGAPLKLRPVDLVREGHPLMAGRESLFVPFEPQVKYDLPPKRGE